MRSDSSFHKIQSVVFVLDVLSVWHVPLGLRSRVEKYSKRPCLTYPILQQTAGNQKKTSKYLGLVSSLTYFHFSFRDSLVKSKLFCRWDVERKSRCFIWQDPDVT